MRLKSGSGNPSYERLDGLKPRSLFGGILAVFVCTLPDGTLELIDDFIGKLCPRDVGRYIEGE